nr:MAG TPA: hypothetical protein [Caudoviricetes sp.]
MIEHGLYRSQVAPPPSKSKKRRGARPVRSFLYSFTAFQVLYG